MSELTDYWSDKLFIAPLSPLAWICQLARVLPSDCKFLCKKETNYYILLSKIMYLP